MEKSKLVMDEEKKIMIKELKKICHETEKERSRLQGVYLGKSDLSPYDKRLKSLNAVIEILKAK